jgi:hypothetical protein
MASVPRPGHPGIGTAASLSVAPSAFTTKPSKSTATPRDPIGITSHGTPVTTAATTAATSATGFTTDQQSAFDYMTGLLAQYRLDSLAGTLKDLILAGDTYPNVLMLKLQSTDAWKQRFAGNEMLRASGHNVLSVDQYLATENSYFQVLKQYGLPSGFYDDPSDFAKFIGNGVSPAELAERASMYSDLAGNEDPSLVKALSTLGLGRGDLAAWMMDPTRAEPLIKRRYNEALIGSAAIGQGLSTSESRLGQLLDQGVTVDQARQGFEQVAEDLPTFDKLGDIYGENIDQSTLENAVFGLSADDTRKTKGLASRERAAFTGDSGITQGSLHRNNSGQF